MAIRLRYDIECGAGLLQRVVYFSLLGEISNMSLSASKTVVRAKESWELLPKKPRLVCEHCVYLVFFAQQSSHREGLYQGGGEVAAVCNHPGGIRYSSMDWVAEGRIISFDRITVIE
jgi:hypothetical protein